MLVHGGIDGCSRIPVYLRVVSNNTADIVLEGFTHAVSKYGLPPSRVRADHGGENVCNFLGFLSSAILEIPYLSQKKLFNQSCNNFE